MIYLDNSSTSFYKPHEVISSVSATLKICRLMQAEPDIIMLKSGVCAQRHQSEGSEFVRIRAATHNIYLRLHRFAESGHIRFKHQR